MSNVHSEQRPAALCLPGLHCIRTVGRVSAAPPGVFLLFIKFVIYVQIKHSLLLQDM